MGALVRRARLLGVYMRAPDFWKLPYVAHAMRAVIWDRYHSP